MIVIAFSTILKTNSMNYIFSVLFIFPQFGLRKLHIAFIFLIMPAVYMPTAIVIGKLTDIFVSLSLHAIIAIKVWTDS